MSEYSDLVFEYNGNEYKVIEDSVLSKCIGKSMDKCGECPFLVDGQKPCNQRGWISSVIYENVCSRNIYCRTEKDFKNFLNKKVYGKKC